MKTGSRKWNPAPWHLDRDKAQVLDARDNVVCTMNLVDRRSGHLDTTEAEANGMLLAEAPALYDAGILALAAINDIAEGRHPNLKLVAHNLKNATRAARGEETVAAVV